MYVEMIDETGQVSEEIKKQTLELLDFAAQKLGKKDKEMAVTFVTNERSHELNLEYRDTDRPTDVISFAIQDDMSDMWIEEDQYELGDIFINVQAIRDQAKAYGHSIRREACFLFCHGLLHLMGYDHMKEEDEKVMFALQDEILDELVQR